MLALPVVRAQQSEDATVQRVRAALAASEQELVESVRALIVAARSRPSAASALGPVRQELWAAERFSLALQVGIKQVEMAGGDPKVARRIVAELEQLVRAEPSVGAFAAIQVWFYVAEFSIRDWELARADRALDRLRELLPELRRVWPAGTARSEVMAHGLATRLDTARGRPRAALRSGLAAVRAAEPIRTTAVGRRSWLEAHLDLVDAALAARLPGLAEGALGDALAVAEDSKLRVLLQMRLSSSLAAQGRTSDAVLAPSALALDEPACVGALRLGCLLQRCQWLWRAGRRDAARDEFARAERLAGELRTGAGPLRVADELVLAAFATRTATSESSAEQRARLERLEVAFDALLSGWQRSRDLERRRGVGFLHYGSRRMVVGELVDATLRGVPGSDGVRRALRQVVRSRALGSVAGAAGVADGELTPARLDAMIDAVCPRHGGLLVYVRGDVRLRVFAVDRERAAAFDVGPVAVGAVRDGARRRELPLPEPCRTWIEDRGWRSVAVTGWTELGAMRPAAPRGPWPITVLPSLWVGAILAARDGRLAAGTLTGSVARRAVPGQDDAAVVVVTGGQPAAETGAEAFELSLDDEKAAALGSARVRWYRGAAATPDAIAEPSLHRAGVLVVLAHGVREARTGGTRLALAAGGSGPWLDADAIRRLVTHAGAAPRLPPVVVLMACDAGRSPNLAGEDGGQDLATACLEAGARVVVLATDRIPLRRALEFCDSFGQALRSGATPATAVHRLDDARIRVVGAGHRTK